MDKDRFISVIKENQNLIFKICHSYCSHPEDRKDLQQEILIQLWSSFKKFDGRVKLSTWIYRIALNTAISFYRKESKHKEKTAPMDASIIFLSDTQSDSEQQEKVAMLYRFIESLNEIDKALMLLYLDDNTYRVIAEVLGISETNVATKISRIKKTLRAQIINE